MSHSTPIKRHPAIVSFSKDHHFGLLLSWKIRQGLKLSVSPDRISNYTIYFFEEDLLKHFQEEEEWLFCHLPAEHPLRQKAEAEHAAIVNLVSELKTDKQSTPLLNHLADQLENHIRFEERELFGYLQQHIPAATLEAIVHRTPNNGQQIDDQWEDAFWK